MSYYFVKKEKRISRKMKRFAGSIFIGFGLLVLVYFFFPLLSYQLFFGSGDNLATPVPKYAVVGQNTFGSLIAQGLSHLSTNFNDARNWYPTIRPTNNASVPLYSISIPKLKIDSAQVSTTDYDLSRHLVQYAGTAIPGENGTAVIFGHSTLPQWFDPKNYKAIFATLHTIHDGDTILAKVNGVTYTYKIFSITITSPEDTNIFSQSFDHSYLTIVTCTPPGTIWKRLIVKAALQQTGKGFSKLPSAETLLAGTFRY